MPKENTHILFVKRIINALDCEELKTLMQTDYESVCFGSIMADTFFYSSNKEVVNISEELHGKEGEETNEIIFDLLDHARLYMAGKLLCVTMGYISHCVFDMIFHPIIYALTGNYYDKDTTRSDHAVYKHRLIETKLDMQINGTYFMDKILDVNDESVHSVFNIISLKYNVSKSELIETLKKQISCNRSFRNGFIYRLIYMLNKIKVLNYKKILPLFYGHLHRDGIEIGELILYRDMLTGQEKEARLTELLKAAEDESIKRISAAYAYYSIKMDKAEAMQIIRGESLDTGKEGCSVSELRTFHG